MKKPIGAVISVVLLCMVFCTLPVGADDAEEDEPYLGSVAIDWVNLTSSDQYFKNGNQYAAVGTPDNYNAHYDPETGVLTLRDLNIQTNGHNGIFASNDITIVLEGKNSITMRSTDQKTYTALSAPNLVIKGTGSLTINASTNITATGHCLDFGIQTGILTLESGDVEIDYAYLYSISATDLTICGGKLTTKGVGGIACTNYVQSGGTVYAEHPYVPLYIKSSATITGGTVTAICTDSKQRAFVCAGTPVLNGCGSSSATVSVGSNKDSASEWDADTELSAYQYVSIAVNAHTASPVSGTSPTWLETGLTEGSYCSVCGQTLTVQQAVAPTGPTVVSKITTVYDDNTRTVTLTNVPTGMTVALGAYDGGRMVFTDFKTGVADAPISFQLPSGISVDGVQAFFLTDDWRPVASARAVSLTS